MSDAFTDVVYKPSEPKMEVSVLPRWTDPTRSENIEQLVQALALAQAKIRSPERNREVKVTPKSGGQGYSFRYATLDHIIDMVRLPLTENGLWFTQIMKLDEGTYILDTRLMHGSGQWIACQTPLLFDGGGNQQFGSALTFMRRYSLTSLLGIAAEEDDDANAADGNVINQVQDRKPIAPKPDVMKEDPISTGIKIKSGLPTNEPPGDGVAITTIQGPYKIVIGMNANQTGSDWVSFGKELIASIKESPNSEMAEMWRELNQTALGQMEKDAPKTFANLSMSIIKAINDLKKEETKA